MYRRSRGIAFYSVLLCGGTHFHRQDDDQTIQEYMTNCREMPLMFDGAECAVCGVGLVQHHTFMYSPSILAVCVAHTTTPPTCPTSNCRLEKVRHDTPLRE
ncbi:hypothetical protein ARMSODRAFT_674141 [Armillaria solidipes]|uniref:Uncharacterized protein n=1 Tax=Armillaria solidipes TaxID=1076256 RepID=A0A2H3B229_9AGAR|nr:hypothetical protein ARMSODRAFT_674141 [Armillaria solidipes]